MKIASIPLPGWRMLAAFSDDGLARTIECLHANIERPGAREALEFAMAERGKRRTPTPAPARVTTVQKPAEPTKFAASSPPAVKAAADPFRDEVPMTDDEEENAFHVWTEAHAAGARRLMAAAAERGEELPANEAVRLAKLPANHVERMAMSARAIVHEFAERGETIDVVDAMIIARRRL